MERRQRTNLDPSAFERLMVEYHEAIRRLVFRLLGWRDGGDDVVQDVFLAAWGAWHRYPGPDTAELWLKRIAVNKCRSRFRRDAVRLRWLGWMRGAAQPTQDGAGDVLISQERATRVQTAIQSLGASYREITVLHYLEEMSIDTIANLLGMRRNTVEVRLYRARKKLEIFLADLVE